MNDLSYDCNHVARNVIKSAARTQRQRGVKVSNKPNKQRCAIRMPDGSVYRFDGDDYKAVMDEAMPHVNKYDYLFYIARIL